MSTEMNDELIRVMKQIQTDCASDAHALDGTPFTGAAVAPVLGNIFAMIEALARAVEDIARAGGVSESPT